MQSYASVSDEGLEIDEDNGSSGLQEYLESVFEIEDEGLVGAYESRVQQLSALLATPGVVDVASTGLGLASAYESTIVECSDGYGSTSRFMR
jgi:hypothetical protein